PYRTLVYGSGDLFRLFLDTTPVRELADVRFGSRPAYRAPGEETMEGMRAIPWVFGWTQTRLMLPGWLGVGTALEAVGSEPGGLAVLRRMAQAWPFFDDLLAKVEMVCAKADLAIARMYVRELGGDLALFDHLENEFRRTIAALLRIRESDYLMRDNPMLQTAIGLRNPYVDPLSLLQVTLLQRKRHGDPAPGPVSAGLASTLNGIAQGLRNTGKSCDAPNRATAWGMQRRAFVHALGASPATEPWASRGMGSPRRLNRIGLELYSVRDAMGRDPDGTLAAVRAMGYTDVELLWSFGNFGRTTEQVRAALDHEGLRAPSAHVSPTVVLVGWERSLAIAHTRR